MIRRASVDLVGSAGRVLKIGLSDYKVSLPTSEFTRKKLAMLGTQNAAGLSGENVSLLHRHRNRVGRVITQRYMESG